MSALTEWLLACIAEDESVARKVEAAAREDFERSPVDYGNADPTQEAGCWQADGNSGDPVFVVGVAQALAVCKAHRAIVELHKAWPVLAESPPVIEPLTQVDIRDMTFRMSKQIAWTTEQAYRERFGIEPPTAPMIRALATIYADRPGYREEWKP